MHTIVYRLVIDPNTIKDALKNLMEKKLLVCYLMFNFVVQM